MDKNHVPAVNRALDVLEYLENTSSAALKQISDTLELPRVTTYRIIKTLEDRGYIYKLSRNGEYALGAKSVSLGNAITEKDDVPEMAYPMLVALSNATNQTVQLGVLVEHQVMYVRQVRSSRAVSVIAPLRHPFSINISAGGKVLAAYLPLGQQEALLQRVQMAKNTVHSITDPELLRKELAKVKLQGYAEDMEEFSIGIRCIGAPVFNRYGSCVASVGITGQTSEINERNHADFRKAVVMTATAISQELGYDG